MDSRKKQRVMFEAARFLSDEELRLRYERAKTASEARKWLIIWFATPPDPSDSPQQVPQQTPKQRARREGIRPLRVRDIAELLMCSERHVYNVISRYNYAPDAREAVLRMRSSTHQRGRKKLLTNAQYQHLAEYVRDYAERGLKVSLKDIQDYTHTNFGVHLSRATVSRYRRDILQD